MTLKEADIPRWADWLRQYGAEKFARSLFRDVQGAKSRCTQCGDAIYLDFFEGGGVGDWKTKNGDYGCVESPDTGKDGTGGHRPVKLR